MEIPLTIEGLEGCNVSVRIGGVLAGEKVLVDGQPVPRGEKKNTFLVQKSDGTQVLVRLYSRASGAIFAEINQRNVQISPPLRWYQHIWAGLPLLLVFAGGAIGGAVGIVALIINRRLFITRRGLIHRYGTTTLVTIIAVVVYFVVAAVIEAMIGG